MWIDVAYKVHSEMRSHTGGAISMGHRVFHEKPSMQRLNTKIFTEVDLVDVSEYLSYNLWLIFFLYGKGYEIVNNRVYQEKNCNKSGEKLEEFLYWKLETYRYQVFFVRDRVDKRE